MTALLSGNSLTTTFWEITMDEDHYLYFYDGSSLISMWYPDTSTSNNTSGNLVSAYEDDGNYVLILDRGLHLDAGNLLVVVVLPRSHRHLPSRLQPIQLTRKNGGLWYVRSASIWIFGQLQDGRVYSNCWLQCCYLA